MQVDMFFGMIGSVIAAITLNLWGKRNCSEEKRSLFVLQLIELLGVIGDEWVTQEHISLGKTEYKWTEEWSIQLIVMYNVRFCFDGL